MQYLLTIDPYHEHLLTEAMTLVAEIEGEAALDKFYELKKAALRDELSLNPSAEMQEHYQRLKK